MNGPRSGCFWAALTSVCSDRAKREKRNGAQSNQLRLKAATIVIMTSGPSWNLKPRSLVVSNLNPFHFHLPISHLRSPIRTLSMSGQAYYRRVSPDYWPVDEPDRLHSSERNPVPTIQNFEKEQL